MSAASSHSQAVAGPAPAPAPASGDARVRARSSSFGALLLLGTSLARRGVLASIAIVITLLTAAVAVLVAVVLAARGGHAPIHDVPLVASGALAWGGGFLLAFSAAAHALRRDRAEGVRDLVVARTRSLRGYLVARIGGLAFLVALLVAGGSLVVGLVATVSAARMAAVPRTLHATAAAVVFSLAFAAIVAPIAFAALGARSRVGGYVFLLAVVMLPELVVSAMAPSLPEGLADVLSIPSALAALRTALSPGSVEIARAVRALVALAFFVAFAVFLVRRDAIAVAEEEPR